MKVTIINFKNRNTKKISALESYKVIGKEVRKTFVVKRFHCKISLTIKKVLVSLILLSKDLSFNSGFTAWSVSKSLHFPHLQNKWSEVAQSCLTHCDPWTVAYQNALSMEFSRQGYWSGLPFPSPGDLPDPGTEPISPALTADSLLLIHPGSHCSVLLCKIIIFLWTFCVLFQINMWNAHLFTLPPCPHKSKW